MAGGSPRFLRLLVFVFVAVTSSRALSSSSLPPRPRTASGPAPACGGGSASSPLTAGFTRVPLRQSQFVVQKPWDVPLFDRYSFGADGVRRMWVFATDKPGSAFHPGGARTEIKVDEVYSSGVWQFEGDMYVPAGTSGASVMQVFGAAGPGQATTLMLHVYDGRLTYYHQLSSVVAEAVYDRWVRLNVVHDVSGGGNVTVFVDGEHRLSAPGHGGAKHYFKFGVYKQSRHQPSYRMESWWKNVAVYRKD